MHFIFERTTDDEITVSIEKCGRTFHNVVILSDINSSNPLLSTQFIGMSAIGNIVAVWPQVSEEIIVKGKDSFSI